MKKDLQNQKRLFCSACLIGVRCRYDGRGCPDRSIPHLLKRGWLIVPVCPEQLGGLPTPREYAERKDDRVVIRSGKEVTAEFKKGAKEVLRLAKILDIKKAIMKELSPSCGVHKIYDGTFSGRIIEGEGITTELLKHHNISVISDEELKNKI